MARKKEKKENKLKKRFSNFWDLVKSNKVFSIAILISVVVLAVLLYINSYQSAGFSKLDIKEFEIGMVSDRDIVSNRSFEYVDEKATEIKRIAALNTVPPVFYRDMDLTSKMLQDYSEFINFITDIKSNSKNFTDFKFAVLEKFPTLIKAKDLKLLYDYENFDEVTSVSVNLLKQMLDVGILEIPSKGLQDLNETEFKIVTKNFDKNAYENVSVKSLINLAEVKNYLQATLAILKQQNMQEAIGFLILPFIKANIIFDSEATEMQKNSTLNKIKPVKIKIEKNQRIIKKGFVINENAYNELEIYAGEKSYIDLHQFFASFILLIFILIFGTFITSKRITGIDLSQYFRLLILLFFDFIYILVLYTSPLSIFDIPLNVSVILPVAFFAMMISALISKRIAVFSTIILTLAVFAASAYKVQPTLFALFTGMCGIAFIHITGKRMDLIKTAVFLTLIQPVIGLALIFIFSAPGVGSDIYILLLELAANGFISGIFVLGFLPILESILNTPTSFRLMELSDLNSPMMKKLLVTIPGTYNHSVMVATLAETACRAIGANSLLARVGGYYHDIGKMDQGEYFVENQQGYNKHLEINPRLSATVIRSHVKLGVERARQMRFPQEVIDIISEHHGNSFIAYFYEKAKELDPNVDREDFAYPGTPPRSKESAVVMLADTVEAACRTLPKPTASSLEKFIDKLVAGKIEIGMLDNCELTFREITIIKECFLTILTGYYHSRIAYPNQNTDDDVEINDPKTAKELKKETHKEENKKIEDKADKKTANKEEAKKEKKSADNKKKNTSSSIKKKTEKKNKKSDTKISKKKD